MTSRFGMTGKCADSGNGRQYSGLFEPSPSVARAIAANQPVVALESTVIAHGLPAGHNLETARGCEAAVRSGGAEPATVGIVEGRAVLGLSPSQVEEMATRQDVVKVNLANLAHVMARGGWGATTVAATMHLAHRVGIYVVATGGIGGAHRGANESFDVSADVTALARYPVVVVCAGAKSILDLPKTLELLETLGVPVIGYQTEEFPAFYSRSSGLPLSCCADQPSQIAAIAAAHWRTGLVTAVLVVTPVPKEDEVPAGEIEAAVNEALALVQHRKVTGTAVTPILLARIADRTGGRALRANVALLKNNARLGAEIACAMARS
jgi:pseudouridine-5'-phosphate glycosidase